MKWRMSGDLGDAIFGLAVMQAVKGKHQLMCVDRPGITAPFTPRVPLLKSLFEAQDYIESVECSEKSVDIDLVPFRRFHSNTTTLVAAQASEYQLKTDEYPDLDVSNPWLTVNPDKSFDGKVLIARSPRYNNPWFPWQQIVKHYGNRILFIGLREEHRAFTAQYGSVQHIQFKDFLEMAQAMAGCSLFIGNQSSPHAVAMGLGVNIIQETCQEQPDCIFNRKNVQYCCDGKCVLPDVSGSGILEIPRQIKLNINISKDACPPGFWQYPNLPPSTHYVVQQRLVAQLEQCSLDEAEVKLSTYNVKRTPEFFKHYTNNPLEIFEAAYSKAFPQSKLVELSSQTN